MSTTKRELEPVSKAPTPDAPPALERHAFVVFGRVFRPDGRPVAGVQVRAAHQYLRTETPLGEPARTDDRGVYDIPYTPPEGLFAADIVVRVFTMDGDRELARSPLVCHAHRAQPVDLVVGDEPYRGPSEFERLTRLVNAYLDDTPIGMLSADEVELLACKTRQDAQHLRRLVLAQRHEERTDVPAVAFYAFSSHGLPSDAAAALSLRPAVQREALRSAVADNIVPVASAAEIDALVLRCKQAAVALALYVPDGEEATSLAGLLATTNLPADQRMEVLKRYELRAGTVAEYWAALEADPAVGPEAVRQLQLTLQLGTLTGGFVPIVQELRGKLGPDQNATVAELAALTAEDWLSLVQRTGTPPGVPGATPAERALRYATGLQQTIERAFPTRFIAEGLRRRDRADEGELLTFFDNSPDYQFTASVDVYLEEHGDTALDGISDVPALTQRLKTMQRLYRLTPDADRLAAMTSLADAGIESAHAIVRAGRERFADTFAPALGGRDIADTVWNKADQTASLALTIFGRYAPPFNIPFAVLPGPAPRDNGVPSWETLFGQLTYCACEHCRSVYSPAAYLVDLLEYVRQQPALRIRADGTTTTPDVTEPDGSVRPMTALDVLFERRADIGHILLSCDNTNTELSLVDIVNEILEGAVAGQQAVHQTTWTAEELRANAEHVNELAYERLARQVYPRGLPFSLWLEEARTYLGHLGVTLHDLMDTVQRPGLSAAGGALQRQIAYERLGLSPQEARIITGSPTPTHSPEEYWGTDATNWPDALADLQTFLRQAELSYDAFTDLLISRFVDPDGAIAVEFAEPCTLEGATIKNLIETALDRIHRILRLQRAVGWTTLELDSAIAALGAADLTPDFLVQLAQIRRLTEQLGTPVMEALSWWSGISTTLHGEGAGATSLYDDLFLNNAVLSPSNAAFELDADRGELVGAGTERIGDHTAAIIAALAISDAELSLTLGFASLTAADGLTLDHLSRLHREVSLARALDLSVASFVSVCSLTGLDPFASPAAALEVAERAQAIADSTFSIADLDYLLRHVYDEAAGLAPTTSAISLVLDEIGTELRAIGTEHTFASDPTGAFTRSRLALLLAEPEVQTAMALLAGVSTLSEAEQEAFIDEHFAAFLDPTDAKEQFVGTGALIDPQARYEYALGPLLAHLTATLSTAHVVRAIADALGLDVAVAEAVLSRYVATPSDPSRKAIEPFLDLAVETEEYPPLVLDTYRLLQKIATVLARLGTIADELEWLFETGRSLGWLDLPLLPLAATHDPLIVAPLFRGWERLVALYRLRDQYVAGDTTIFDVLASAHRGDPRETALTALASATGWEYHDLDFLTGPGAFDLTYPAHYRDERYLLRLEAAAGLLRRLGIAAAQVAGWRVTPDLAELRGIARDIKSTAKAKYDVTAWTSIAEPLKNSLRERQRSALVAHLMATRHGLTSTSDLYARFLIDVEMSACMATSRIKQAISSAQLFVQRCLMNLEPHAEISEAAAAQWEWMKSYRVWEANRKIFLYPENWIEPELRDDKSPFFVELENELLQNEVTEQAAETTLANYLRKLDEVANLDVRALYHQKDDGSGSGDALHVVARTHSAPHVYYYRRRVDSNSWTPWERVGVDVQGDHLLALVRNGRLQLYWPLFRESGAVEQTQTTTHETEAEQEPCPSLISLLESHFRFLLDAENETVWAYHKEAIGGYLVPTLQAGLDQPGFDFQAAAAGYGNLLDRAFDDFSFSGYEAVIDQWVTCRTEPAPAPTIDVTTTTVQSRIWEVKLAWSEYRDGAWSAKQVSETALTMTIEPTATFVLKPGLAAGPTGNDELTITCLFATPTLKWPIGSFHFAGCAGRVTATPSPDGTYEPAPLLPTSSSPSGMALVERDWADVPLTLVSGAVDAAGEWTRGDSFHHVETLELTPGQFRIAVPHQYEEYVSQDICFYQDDTRSFLVSPRLRLSDPAGSVLDRAELATFEAASPGGWSPYLAIPPVQFRVLRAGLHGPASIMDVPSQPAGSYRPLPADLSTEHGGSHGLVRAAEVATIEAASHSTVPASSTPHHPSADGNATGNATAVAAVASRTVPNDVLFSDRVYRFAPFYHPYACTFLAELGRSGTGGLMRRDLQTASVEFFESTYAPVSSAAPSPYPLDSVDFDHTASYACYNWETFFHVPLLIATRLSENQRFEEAQRWFHYIFNPTARTDPPTVTGPERYWNFYPFHVAMEPPDINALMLALNAGDPELEAQVAEWRASPFNPHLIARLRPSAYQKTVVMKYIDNLIAWGDTLFRQDTSEAVSEATQLYVLAADILGPRPESLPAGVAADETYVTLAPRLDDFSNALVQLENALATPTAWASRKVAPIPTPSVLYFCIPNNEELLGYWDTVADRLFKIRNCMNIEGIVRELPLFEAPLDPAQLVLATAAGVDLSSALSDLYAPLPHHRYQVLSQRALELCGDVRALGAALLAALEKQDAEQLALLRASHETQALDAMQSVREQQAEEAAKIVDSLARTKAVTEGRRQYFATLIDTDLSSYERGQLTLLEDANRIGKNAEREEILANVLFAIPQLTLSFPPEGESGGLHLGHAALAVARWHGTTAMQKSYEANRASLNASYARRREEWRFQLDTAERELVQLDVQIAAAGLRLSIAERELANHDQQAERARAVQDLMTAKYTNQELFGWMVSQVAALYSQSYQLAYDVAKRAQRAYEHELGVTGADFIRFGYWDSLKKGLLAGERLQNDLRRLDAAYLDADAREYELTKHISLALIDPVALIKLRREGRCFLQLPEALFDLDHPGHYMRRLKAVNLTIPSVAGPYAGIGCRLTLESSSVRVSTSTSSVATAAGYLRGAPLDGDERFRDDFGLSESIVTSVGQHDHGLFDVDLRDPRYLPFERRGVISAWKLELTSALPAFDYESISDVVFGLRYTARDGGEALRQRTLEVITDALRALTTASGTTGLTQAFSIRHEFADAWYRFLNPPADASVQTLELPIDATYFPFQFQQSGIRISAASLYLLPEPGLESPPSSVDVSLNLTDGGSADVTLMPAALPSDSHALRPFLQAEGVELAGAPAAVSLTTADGLSDQAIDDLILVFNYEVLDHSA